MRGMHNARNIKIGTYGFEQAGEFKKVESIIDGAAGKIPEIQEKYIKQTEHFTITKRFKQ